ncbi:MAG: aminotransferase class I/II-fold pyridoxal phosphate-dependent enzyme [Myxococcota bacterium]|nr:aminotransferase class I/II-fold pyridoxal phosphate-dependent enzyme [Myxococcota bacterium]
MKRDNDKLSFASDNHAPIAPKILQAIIEANVGSAAAYGTDTLSAETRKLFKLAFGPQARAQWVFNGTAANVLALKTLLEPWHAVICAKSSHLNLDECAAPEAVGGIKLIPVESPDGKLSPHQIREEIVRRGDQHFAQPYVVSITQPTEWGTLYSLEELEELRDLCQELKLKLHIDGARFSVAAAKLNVDFETIAQSSGAAAISFGGTKNGLLGAEAVIFFDKSLEERFRYLRKQMMQLPSKTRFLAAQFKVFLEGDYWRELASIGIDLANHLSEQSRQIPGVEIIQKTQANSVFARIPKHWNKTLRESAFFYVWEESSNTVRWMFSFDHEINDVNEFLETLRQLSRDDQCSHSK